jgi:hypothetical protein
VLLAVALAAAAAAAVDVLQSAAQAALYQAQLEQLALHPAVVTAVVEGIVSMLLTSSSSLCQYCLINTMLVTQLYNWKLCSVHRAVWRVTVEHIYIYIAYNILHACTAHRKQIIMQLAAVAAISIIQVHIVASQSTAS